MKKLLLTAQFIICILLITNAQIVLEKTYSAQNFSDVFSTNLGSLGYKYWRSVMDSNQLILYNIDHSIYRIISVPPQPVSYGIAYVSDSLFDLDPDIDYMLFLWNTPFSFFIYNENGTSLLSVKSAQPKNFNNGVYSFKPILYTDNGFKLNLKTASGADSNFIYSLPGFLRCNICNNGRITTGIQGGGQIFNEFLSNSYPNPSKDFTKINYKLPDNERYGEILFYTVDGKEMKRYKVDNTLNTLLINNSDLPSGTYLYHLVTSSNTTSAKKMLVIK